VVGYIPYSWFFIDETAQYRPVKEALFYQAWGLDPEARARWVLEDDAGDERWPSMDYDERLRLTAILVPTLIGRGPMTWEEIGAIGSLTDEGWTVSVYFTHSSAAFRGKPTIHLRRGDEVAFKEGDELIPLIVEFLRESRRISPAPTNGTFVKKDPNTENRSILFCAGCGHEEAVQLPMVVRQFCDVVDGFSKRHASCAKALQPIRIQKEIRT
jgi:hypothetical protein